MKVYVNGCAVFVLEGMTVRHALLASNLREEGKPLLVRDEWDNEIGLDGALHEGQKLFVPDVPHDKE